MNQRNLDQQDTESTDDPLDSGRDIVALLHRLGHLVAVLDPVLRQRWDLSLVEYRLLVLIHPKPTMQKDIAEQLGCSHAEVSRTITQMRCVRWVKTYHAENSQKLKIVKIERRGRALVRSAYRYLAEHLKAMESALSEDELVLLQRVEGNLRKLVRLSDRLLKADDAESTSEPPKRTPGSDGEKADLPPTHRGPAPQSSSVYSQGITRYTRSPSIGR